MEEIEFDFRGRWREMEGIGTDFGVAPAERLSYRGLRAYDSRPHTHRSTSQDPWLITCRGDGVSGLQISGCVTEGRMQLLATFHGECRNIHVSDCLSGGSVENQISLSCSIPFSSITNATVANCLLYDSPQGINVAADATNDANCALKNITLIGNVLNGCGIYVEGAQLCNEDISIIGNTGVGRLRTPNWTGLSEEVYFNPFGIGCVPRSAPQWAAYGEATAPFVRLTIRANTFSTYRDGLRVENATRPQIASNRLADYYRSIVASCEEPQISDLVCEVAPTSMEADEPQYAFRLHRSTRPRLSRARILGGEGARPAQRALVVSSCSEARLESVDVTGGRFPLEVASAEVELVGGSLLRPGLHDHLVGLTQADAAGEPLPDGSSAPTEVRLDLLSVRVGDEEGRASRIFDVVAEDPAKVWVSWSGANVGSLPYSASGALANGLQRRVAEHEELAYLSDEDLGQAPGAIALRDALVEAGLMASAA